MIKLTGNGRPTVYTKGQLGQYYEDLTTGNIYECRQSSKYSKLHGAPVGGYIWELRASGEDRNEHSEFFGGYNGPYFGSNYAHKNIIWDGNTDELEFAQNSYGVNIYRLNVDVSGLTAKDFVNVKVLRASHLTDDNMGPSGPLGCNYLLREENISEDGKSISWFSSGFNPKFAYNYRAFVFVEPGGTFEHDGVTYTPGLWMNVHDYRENGISVEVAVALYFPEIITTIPEKYLPEGLYKTCLLAYWELDEAIFSSMTLSEIQNLAIGVQFAFVNGDFLEWSSMVMARYIEGEDEETRIELQIYLVSRGMDNPLKVKITEDGASIIQDVEEDAGPS